MGLIMDHNQSAYLLLPTCVVSSQETHLDAQLAGDVSEWLQLLGVFADTLQVVLAELILGVDQGEDALHQSGPEV